MHESFTTISSPFKIVSENSSLSESSSIFVFTERTASALFVVHKKLPRSKLEVSPSKNFIQCPLGISP